MDSKEFYCFCNTYLYSESSGNTRKKAARYVSDLLGYPETGSNFERELGNLRYLFRTGSFGQSITSLGLWYLEQRHYDALILELAEKIIGHTAFQMHADRTLHIFSVEVQPEYRGNGLGQSMTEETIIRARKKGIKRVRIGAGRNQATNSIHQSFTSRADELRISVREGNWIDILD